MAVYFGFADPPPSTGGVVLRRVRPSLLFASVVSVGFAVLSTGVAIVLFDWTASEVAIGGAIGTIVFCAVTYYAETGGLVPVGALEPPPPDALILDAATDRRTAVRWVWLVPGCFLLAWLADLGGLAGVFVPGLLTGRAAAQLVGAFRIGRWERAHGRVVTGSLGPDADLYAALPEGERLHSTDIRGQTP